MWKILKNDHFETQKCHFWEFLAFFKISLFSLQHPTHIPFGKYGKKHGRLIYTSPAYFIFLKTVWSKCIRQNLAKSVRVQSCPARLDQKTFVTTGLDFLNRAIFFPISIGTFFCTILTVQNMKIVSLENLVQYHFYIVEIQWRLVLKSEKMKSIPPHFCNCNQLF